MKIKQNILTVQGGNEAEIALETEVKEVFKGSPYRGYCVLGTLEKLAKKDELPAFAHYFSTHPSPKQRIYLLKNKR